MSVLVDDSEIGIARDAQRLHLNVRRKAFYFESQGQPLFAWLHDRHPTPSFDHGIILCPPIGYEQVHSHRAWRQLADALAEVGFPVLRFDYHGTGDSAGADEDADRYATWLMNIRDARLWMQRERDCKQISLVGLRLGASLAMRAAAAEKVASLLLWAPVVSGRSYVREMKALNSIATTMAPPLPESPDDIEAAGFIITKQTADDLAKLSLLEVHPQCRRAMIFGRDDTPQDRRLYAHLLGLGIQVEENVQPGYAGIMAEPHNVKVPRQAIANAVEWLLAGVTSSNSPSHSIVDATVLSAQAAVITGQGTQASIRERSLGIGEESGLSAVLSESARGSTEHLPVILLVNAGSTYRIGPGRLHVFLGRELALRGFRCVRIDMSGFGESSAFGCDNENDPYAATAFRDIEIALRYLESQLGAKRAVLMGLCSGAYFAFQAAVQMSNPVLVESVLINPLTFYWKDGMSLNESPSKDHETFHYYWNAARQPRKWLKLLRGKTKVGFFGAITTLVRHWRSRNSTVDGSEAPIRDGVGHPLRDNLPADLVRLEKTGRHLACFFSESDPGHTQLHFRAKGEVRELVRSGKLSVFLRENADHTFSHRAPRRALVQAIADYLCERYQRSYAKED